MAGALADAIALPSTIGSLSAMYRSRPKPCTSRNDRFGAAAKQCTVMCVRAVRGDRQVEGLGQVRDLHPHGHAAAIGDVGLRNSTAPAWMNWVNS